MVAHQTQRLSSKFFTLEEFTKSNTADNHGIENIPSADVVDNINYGCHKILDPLRQEVGKPVIITSGFRCPELNRLVGGVYNSWHQFGNAADIYVSGEDDAKFLFNLLRKNVYVDTVLFEHSKKSIWLHVQWDKNKKPRHHCNFNFIAK